MPAHLYEGCQSVYWTLFSLRLLYVYIFNPTNILTFFFSVETIVAREILCCSSSLTHFFYTMPSPKTIHFCLHRDFVTVGCLNSCQFRVDNVFRSDREAVYSRNWREFRQPPVTKKSHVYRFGGGYGTPRRGKCPATTNRGVEMLDLRRKGGQLPLCKSSSLDAKELRLSLHWHL